MKKIRIFIISICMILCMFASLSYVAYTTSVMAASSTSSSTSKKIDVVKLKVKLSKTKYIYNGKEKKPKVTVTYKGKKLSTENYVVKYSPGRKLPGTYSVTVTLKGKYTGKKTLNYKIVVETPKVEIIKSSNKVDLIWDETKKATGYLVYNSNKELIEKTYVNLSVIENLKPGRKYVFYVRSYVKINGKNYYSSYAKASFVTKPTINGQKMMYIGEKQTLKANAKGVVTWTSSDNSIATVSSKGKVTAIKAGTVTIKAKVNGVTASYKLTIKKPVLKLNKNSLDVQLFKSASLKATAEPSDMVLTWKSSNPDIVRVTSSGKVIALGQGLAIITVEGEYEGKTYKKSCEVVVDVTNVISFEDMHSKTNSAEGVSLGITITNNTIVDIKYIELNVEFKNKFGDPVYCEVKNKKSAILLADLGLWAKETKEIFWDNIIYNDRVSRIDINKVVVTFVDNTKVEFDAEQYWYKSDYYYQ